MHGHYLAVTVVLVPHLFDRSSRNTLRHRTPKHHAEEYTVAFERVTDWTFEVVGVWSDLICGLCKYKRPRNIMVYQWYTACTQLQHVCTCFFVHSFKDMSMHGLSVCSLFQMSVHSFNDWGES